MSSKKAAIIVVFQPCVSLSVLQYQNLCFHTDNPKSETLKSLKPYFLVKGTTVIIKENLRNIQINEH